MITFLKSPDLGKITFVFKILDQELLGDFEKKFQLGNILGSGQFASVYLCIEKENGTQWAAKIIDKKKFSLSISTDRPNALLGEVEILRKINNLGCISIKETFEDEERLILILELVTGGELFDKIIQSKRFDEIKSRHYFIQICEAIKYLHSMGIVHRDLKPENILLKSPSEDIIKLTDFGLSRIMDGGSNMKTLCGTPQYVAPEVLIQSGPDSLGYNKAVDLWSLGVILYIFLSGYPPFNINESYDDIKQANFNFDMDPWPTISLEAKDLIINLLIIDPDKRLDIRGALNHPWITGKNLSDKYKLLLSQIIDEKHKGLRPTFAPIKKEELKTNGKQKSGKKVVKKIKLK